MKVRIALLVYRKELLESLRDRRTLVIMILLPICLYPLIAIGVSQWVGIQATAHRSQASRIGIDGTKRDWPALQSALQDSTKLQFSEWVDPNALRNGTVDLIMRIGPESKRAMGGDGRARVEIFFDGTSAKSKLANKRLRRAMVDFADKMVAARMARRKLTPDLLAPIRVNENNIATKKKRSGHVLGNVLPVLIMLMVLLGAFYPAIDLTAGEKERGTLETLLTAPVPRISIVVGKFLTVSTIATFTGLLNLFALGMTITFGLGPILAKANMAGQIPWGAIALTAIAVVPAAMFFSALMVCIGALARTFKEAQTLLTPVYLVCMIPAMMVQLPGIELTPLTAFMPAINIALLTRDMIAGNVVWALALVALVSTTLYSFLALSFGARIYSSARLLFSEEPMFGKKDDGEDEGDAPLKKVELQPAHVAMLFLVIMAALVLFAQPLQAKNFVSGMLVTEWLIIGLPVLLLIRWGNASAQAVLSLYRPRAIAMVGATLAGVTGWYLVMALVETFQQPYLPIPPEMIKAAEKMLFSGDRPFALDLFLMAVSPAICEELLFRGALLRVSRKVLSTPGVVLLNGVLFGAFHLSVYRFFPSAILGIFLAIIVIRSGSIIPAMLFHFLNNASTLWVSRNVNVGLDDVSVIDTRLLVGAVGLFLIGAYLVYRSKQTKQNEDPEADPPASIKHI
jgi:sodium transport system permease protein